MHASYQKGLKTFNNLYLKYYNQVTFEDAMISGLLSTLNEEAQEDVLNEEDGSLHRGSSGNLSFAGSDIFDKSMEALTMFQSYKTFFFVADSGAYYARVLGKF